MDVKFENFAERYRHKYNECAYANVFMAYEADLIP